jgi:hypothetical protein
MPRYAKQAFVAKRAGSSGVIGIKLPYFQVVIAMRCDTLYI